MSAAHLARLTKAELLALYEREDARWLERSRVSDARLTVEYQRAEAAEEALRLERAVFPREHARAEALDALADEFEALLHVADMTQRQYDAVRDARLLGGADDLDVKEEPANGS